MAAPQVHIYLVSTSRIKLDPAATLLEMQADPKLAVSVVEIPPQPDRLEQPIGLKETQAAAEHRMAAAFRRIISSLVDWQLQLSASN